MPSPFHQRIVRFLFGLLHGAVAALGSGEVFLRRFRSASGPASSAIPTSSISSRGVFPIPIISRKARTWWWKWSAKTMKTGRDLETKRQEYAEAGIAEYWIVDPKERKITVLKLEGSAYRLHGEFGHGATVSSALLPHCSAAVDAVFAAAEA